MTRLHTAAAVIVGLLCSTAPIGAQDSAAQSFAAWRTAMREAGRSAPIATHAAGRVTITVMAADALDRAVRDASLRATAVSCASTYELDAGMTDAIANFGPWARLDGEVADQPTVAISVAPTVTRPPICALDGEPRQVAFANGILYTADTLPLIFVRLAKVEILVDGQVVTPLASASASALRLSPRRQERIPNAQYRAHLAPELFAPSSSGGAPRVELQVWVDDEETPVRVLLPTEVVREAWDAGLMWRAARLAQSPPPASLPIGLPVPEDRVLRAAQTAFRAGDYANASVEALARLRVPGALSRRDAVSARVQLGVTWAAYGDEAAARSVLNELMATEPCLHLPSSAPTTGRRLMDELRPAAYCESLNPVVEFKKALIPGRAHRSSTPGRRLAGQVIFGAVIAQVAVATFAGVQSQQLYSQYRSELNDPTGVWERAEARRSIANAALIGVAATWGLSIIEAAYHAERRRRYVEERRDFGTRETRAFGRVDGAPVSP